LGDLLGEGSWGLGGGDGGVGRDEVDVDAWGTADESVEDERPVFSYIT